MNKLVVLLFLVFAVACSDSKESKIELKSGTIETESVVISSKVNTSLLRKLVDCGNEVKTGDTLAILDSKKIELQIAQAEANLRVAEIQLEITRTGGRKEDIHKTNEMLEQTKISRDLAEKNKSRFENLLESKSISQKDFDEAKLNYDLANSRYLAALEDSKKVKNGRPEEILLAESLVEQAKKQVDLLKENLSDCLILSPMNGVVVNSFVESNENVAFMTSIFKIRDLSEVEIEVYLNSKELVLIKLNDKVEIKIDAFEDKFFEGVVVNISEEAEFTPKNIQTKDERTKLVYAVKIAAKNENQILKPGMPADVIF